LQHAIDDIVALLVNRDVLRASLASSRASCTAHERTKWLLQYLDDNGHDDNLLAAWADALARHPPLKRMLTSEVDDAWTGGAQTMKCADCLWPPSPAQEAERPDIPLADSNRIGRTTEIEHCVDAICAERPKAVALRGMGGQGKTTIARAVINEARVVDRFRSRRSFFRCDKLRTVAALRGQIAAIFGCDQPKRCEATDEFASWLSSAFGLPTLIVLDNYETLLAPDPAADDPDERPHGAKQLLKVLLDVPLLAVIITMRGDDAPSGHRRLTTSQSLVGLASEESRQLFLELAQLEITSDDQGDALDTLLGRLQGHPLSITLLACAATPRTRRSPRSIVTLATEYERRRTQMLRERRIPKSADSTETKLLDVNISLSLSFDDPRLSDFGRDLLRLLAFLPYDVYTEDVPSLMGDDDDANDQLDALSDLSLAILGCVRCRSHSSVSNDSWQVYVLAMRRAEQCHPPPGPSRFCPGPRAPATRAGPSCVGALRAEGTMASSGG
jgi:hypothetical protein